MVRLPVLFVMEMSWVGRLSNSRFVVELERILVCCFEERRSIS